MANSEKINFLIEDYRIKADYLQNHFNRSWTRFNYFLVIESGIAALLVKSLIDTAKTSQNLHFFCLIGIITSFIWYVFGAQDRKWIELYRNQAKDVCKNLAMNFSIPNYKPAGEGLDYQSRRKLPSYIYEWRFNPISNTKLLALLPLSCIVGWVIVWRGI